jgi:serine O-acetyltransferase
MSGRLRDVASLIRSDYGAILRFYGKSHSPSSLGGFLLYPGFIAVALHRFAHYFHRRDWKLPARLVYWLTLVLTGADVNPASDIGPAFVMLHSTGMIVSGKLGSQVILTAAVGIGGDGSARDIGAGPGLPVLGDRVVVGGRSVLMGPVRIGDDAFVCGMSFVVRDVPAGATVFGVPARRTSPSARKNFPRAVAAPVGAAPAADPA